MEDEPTGQRRVDDRATLVMMSTLTERVSSIIKRFDEYAISQKETQAEIKDKLVEHETMVIQTLNSWHWFTVIVSLVSSAVVSLGVFGYTEFSSIRDSVLKHHAEDANKTMQQDKINDSLQKQIDKLTKG
jgi:hypothetical protein